jgi:signal transduction histidine kinase
VFISLDKRAEFRSQLQILRSTHQASVWETFVQPSRSNPVKVSVSTQLGGGERLYWLLRKAEPEAAAKASEVASKIETQDIQMMATVSHELRTPLSSIKGFVSSLLAKDVDFDDATRREFLQIVNEEADKLSELVEQLLDYSRVKSATLRINPEEHHLFDILAMANASLEELTKSHKLEIQVSNDLPLVKADILRVSQVILNLVDNAVKYSPPDSRIAISAHQQDESVQVDVSDQGIGIPPEDRPHVFEAFRQTERKTQLKGTGLGLAICKGIIEAHGGAIWIQDQVVSGTTISFTLPLSE